MRLNVFHVAAATALAGLTLAAMHHFNTDEHAAQETAVISAEQPDLTQADADAAILAFARSVAAPSTPRPAELAVPRQLPVSAVFSLPGRVGRAVTVPDSARAGGGGVSTAGTTIGNRTGSGSRHPDDYRRGYDSSSDFSASLSHRYYNPPTWVSSMMNRSSGSRSPQRGSSRR